MCRQQPVEDVTLGHKIAGKALEIETVLDLGIQVTDALDGGTRQGNHSPVRR